MHDNILPVICLQHMVLCKCILIAVVSFVCCQTFHTPGFGDEDFDVSAGVSSEKYGEESSEVMYADDDDDLQFVDSPVEEEENIATLFMSCSPGRDTEEDEDEDDSVPLSKVYGVNVVYYNLYKLITNRKYFCEFLLVVRIEPTVHLN